MSFRQIRYRPGDTPLKGALAWCSASRAVLVEASAFADSLPAQRDAGTSTESASGA
ncbi:hypothetical protein ACFYXL_11020 [Streptomyces tsukubensis]|uniref:hypothetical protein n=1 Tax=Streptomyces tsukubensis TaxID=83656 RepID=UPI0036CA19A1